MRLLFIWEALLIAISLLVCLTPMASGLDGDDTEPSANHIPKAKTWKRNKRSLITNFNNMYGSCVVETRDEYKYKMWFFGWAAGHANPDQHGADAIYHARSKDLKNWEIYSKDAEWDTTMNPKIWAPVVIPSEKWYDSWHNGDPSVSLKDGKFYMAYSATSRHFGEVPGYPATMVQCVMGATSDDGVQWKKTSSPLLIRAADSPDPTPDPERIGDFHRPSLHWDKGAWRLWFDYWLPGKGVCMGYAENHGAFTQKDGFQIKHDLKEPLLVNWPNPDVIKMGDQYHSFADPSGYPTREGASGWMSRQLREAVSHDGLFWAKLDYIAPDADADACHVPHAFITEIDGEKWLYLFYATQIGYSRDDGQYHYEYDRIRAMRREVD